MALIFRIFLTFVLVTTSVSAHATDDRFGDAGAVLEEETRIFLGPCFFSDLPPTEPTDEKFLVESVLGIALAETVVDFAAGALKTAGEDKSTQAIAAYPANGWMYQLNMNAQLVVNPQSRCIQIISGSFWNGLRVLDGEDFNNVSTRDQTKTVMLDSRQEVEITDPSDANVSVAQWKSSSPIFEQLKSHFRQLRQARFFFETRIEPLQGTDDKFVIAPNAMYLEKPVEQSCFEINPKRNVLVTLTMANAGADGGKAFASVNFPFRDVPSGTLLTPLYFRDHTSRAILAPELTEDEKKSVLAKKAKLNKATSEVQLVKGPPPPPVFVSPNSFENAGYVKAAKTYCSELDKYNVLLVAQSKAATKITAPECPVDLQVAKTTLSKASATFTEFAAHQEAEFNTSNYWLLPDSDPKSLGVSCNPSSSKGFEANCTLTKPTNVRPMTVSASVVEVKEGNKFAAFLGKVLEKAQPGINAAIEAKKPDEEAAASAASEQSKVDREAYQLAVADVETVEAKLADILIKVGATSAEIAQCKKDLLEKKIIANQKARKAELPEPYPIP